MPGWDYGTREGRQMSRLATIIGKIEALQSEKPMDGEMAVALDAARKLLVGVEEAWRAKRYGR